LCSSTMSYGRIFLGRDEKTYGKEGTGNVEYDPDFECGGPEGFSGRRCAYEATTDHTLGLPTIGSEGRLLHVSIASHRDPLCPKTLYRLFFKAKNPKKLRVRVLQQNYPEDVRCLDEYCKIVAKERKEEEENVDTMKNSTEVCPYKDQIFIHHIDASEAAGPTWARGLLSKDMELDHRKKLVSTQDHCMSIDSHMNFEPDWDEKMVNMWDLAKNEYAVLSTYVVDAEKLGMDPLEVPHLCMVKFTSNVRTHATKCVTNMIKPKLTNAVWGAGLSFSKCHAELKVMVDPHTPHVFDGEEFNRAARFFTYGYDIYTPHRVYVLHDYKNSQSNPTAQSWDRSSVKHGSVADSNRRLKTMIDVPGGDENPENALKLKQSKYGLGDRRSLDQLIQFSGIDLRNARPSIDGKNRCGNIAWVPFTEHPKGVNYIPRFDDETEESLDLPYDSTSVWYNHELINKSDVGESKKEDLVASAKDANYNLESVHDTLNDLQKDEGKEPDSVEKLKEDNAYYGDDDLVEEDLQKEHKALSEKIKNAENKNDKKDLITTISDVDLVDKKFNVAKRIVQGTKNLQTRLRRNVGQRKSNGFLVNHSNFRPDQHGFYQLPASIQISVVVLVIGFIASVKLTAKKGRTYVRKKRSL